MRNNKKNFKIFKSKSARKAEEKRALMKALREVGVDYSGAKINVSRDSGYRGRTGKGELVIIGTFSETPHSYGFVVNPEGGRDIFIPGESTSGAVNGDIVKAIYHTYTTAGGEERTEGRIIEITEPKRTVIGTVYTERFRHGRRYVTESFVISDDGKSRRKFYLTNPLDATEGDKVIGKIIRNGSYLCCEVLENLGNSMSKEANYGAILAEFDIETEFSENEIKDAEEAAATPISYEGRTVREEIIFTIDSESAKDLDDAISLEKNAHGWTLGVHIADVSSYVAEKTALERLAMRRGNSVYFTDKVVPMLPPSLSNGACSLNPGEEKYTLSAIINLTDNGDIEDVRIEPSVIKSRIKGIYSEINSIFSNEAEADILKKYEELIPTLTLMRELYLILEERSRKRGAIELDSDEAEIILDENGIPKDIIKRTRGDAERLIEQFMLTANEAVASLLFKKDIPCVYRIHEPPPEDKLSSFITFTHNLGFDTSYISKGQADGRSISRLLDEAKGRGIYAPLSYAALRAMAKAEYSEIRKGHFGLGIKNYCHFTSPIRRLSDLATHRIIHKVLIEGQGAEKYRGYAKRAAAAATDGELRAIGAERKIEDLYKVIYMSDRIGDEYEATVSSITSFGIFATLDNTCEGLIPISDLNGYFIYDEANITMRSENKIYKLGDRINIKVSEADIKRGKLRFSIV